jgi:GTP-binding protein HflX
LFERPESGERAVLVHVNFPEGAGQEDLQEFTELVRSAGAQAVATITATRHSPAARLFVGQGKAAEIQAAVKGHEADLVIFNHPLSPSQERNLERELSCRVLARTGLILDIFAQRARSFEGKLQVELAQLRHLSTRLIRGWTHLERQKGGIGLRGPGETQLETDRRLLADRISQLQKRLAKVDRQREQGRRARKRADLPTVSLVGYTNAGKSTLFNRLTTAEVYAADQLFATLDPTLRRVELPRGKGIVLADTVGFIRHLPHDLVAAFRSTLQETRDADLLLHVIDAHDPERQAKIEQVHAVLTEIDAHEVPQIEVYNKIDLLEQGQPQLERDSDGRPVRVYLSAISGTGMDLLLQAVADFFREEVVQSRLRLPPSAGRLRAALYDLDAVRREQVEDSGEWLLDVEIKAHNLAVLRKQQDFAPLLPSLRAEG